MSNGKNGNLFFFKTLKILVTAAFLAGMSIVFGKYLAIPVGDFMRFSFENTPIILAGIIFGPLVGGAVGAVADLIGCIAVGYTINPLVTLGAASIGLISGASALFFDKVIKSQRLMPKIIISAALAHTVGSLIIKTLGLSAFYSIDLGILFLWRLLNYAIVGTLDCFIAYLLLRSKTLTAQINSIKGKDK